MFAGSPVTTTRLLSQCSGPPPPPCPGEAADTHMSCYTCHVTHVMLHVSCYTCHVISIMLHVSRYTCHVTRVMLHVSRKLSCSVPVALHQLGVARERRGPRVTIVSTIIVSYIVCLSEVSTRLLFTQITQFLPTFASQLRVFATCREITATTDTSASWHYEVEEWGLHLNVELHKTENTRHLICFLEGNI